MIPLPRAGHGPASVLAWTATCALMVTAAAPVAAVPQARPALPSADRQESATAPTAPTAPTAAQEAAPERRIIPFPVLLSDPTNGVGGGGGLLMLYRLNETDPKDSQTAAFGFYTTRSSWKWGLQQEVSFGEDRFRGTATGIFGKTNNSFVYPDAPLPVSYGERQDRLEADFTVRVFDDLYAGVAYRYSRTEFLYDVGTEEEQGFSRVILGIAGAEDTTDSGIGLVLQFDDRDREYAPTRGFLGSLRFLDQSGRLGSDNDYRTADAFLNYYLGLAPENTLAFRFRWRDAWGDVPFTGQSSFNGIDLRAYPSGKYRGTGMLAAQVEYRFPIWKRLGGVAFGGSGRVYGGVPTLGQEEVLPAAGGGIRFLVLKDRGTRVGLDFAQGRFGNRGVYFTFDEAF